MRKVGSLMGRFKNLKAPERNIRLAVISAISEVVGVKVGEESIKIQNESILYISPSSVVKSAIFENKLDIISRINNTLRSDQIVEIR